MRITAGIHAGASVTAVVAATAVSVAVARDGTRRDDPAPPRAVRLATEAAHAELLRELVPPSLDADGIGSIARSLGLDARTAEAVDHHAAA